MDQREEEGRMSRLQLRKNPGKVVLERLECVASCLRERLTFLPQAGNTLSQRAQISLVVVLSASIADSYRATGEPATACLPSRLISWFEPRLPLLPLQLCTLHTLLRLLHELLLLVYASKM
jgi:hypothetical protein